MHEGLLSSCSFFYIYVLLTTLTDNVQICVLDKGWIGGNLAFVEADVALLCELDLQLPIVGFLVDDLEPGVTAVRLPSVGQQMRVFVLPYPFQPGYLEWEGLVRLRRLSKYCVVRN